MTQNEKTVLELAPQIASFLEQICAESNCPPCFQVTISGEFLQRFTHDFRKAVIEMQCERFGVA
jgi:hypothetical protein